MQQRVVLAVEGIGVGLVFREARRGAGMALLAGGQDVGLGQARPGVGRRQHVVMAVAVVAGGDIGGDIRLAQRHRFAVVGIAVMFQPVLVAFSAALVAGHFEVAVLGGLDFVGGVAIGADWSTLVAFGEKLAVDTLVIGLLDADVAFAAGLGDVDVVDRRFAVHGPFDVVDTVAIIAGGGDDEAHLEQGAPVDAVHVLRRRLGILHLVFLRQPRVAVAFGAGPGQVQFEDRRLGFLGRQACRASRGNPSNWRRRKRPACGSRHGCWWRTPCFPFVALDATGRLRRHIIVRVLGSDVRVAIRAGIGLVDRRLEPGFIHEQGDFFASGVGLGERLVRMALQAGAVGTLVRARAERPVRPRHSTSRKQSERFRRLVRGD